MDALNLLLKSNIEKTETAKKKIKIKGLSERVGAEIVFTVRGLTPDESSEVSNNSIDFSKKGEFENMDISKQQAFTLMYGVIDPNFKDEKLAEKFGNIKPIDIINKMLLPGEIAAIAAEIHDLGGYGDDTVEEIKNV